MPFLTRTELLLLSSFYSSIKSAFIHSYKRPHLAVIKHLQHRCTAQKNFITLILLMGTKHQNSQFS